MSNNEQTMQKTCFIEHQIEQVINYVKTHKTLLIVTISINLCIMAFLLVLWLLYAHALPEFKNADKLSFVCNLLVSICTIMLTIFGFYGVLTYKNATKQHMRNELAKLEFTQKYEIINSLMDEVNPINAYFKNIIAYYAFLEVCISDDSNPLGLSKTTIIENIIIRECKIPDLIQKNTISIAAIIMQFEKLKLLNTSDKYIKKLTESIKEYSEFLDELACGNKFGALQSIDNTNDRDAINERILHNVTIYKNRIEHADEIINHVINAARLILNHYDQLDKYTSDQPK